MHESNQTGDFDMDGEGRPSRNGLIIIIGSVVPLLILTAFAGYMIGERRGAASVTPASAAAPGSGSVAEASPLSTEPKDAGAPINSEGALRAAFQGAEPARKLAILDTKSLVPEDDPRVAEIRLMLQRAHEIYAQSDEEIVNITFGVVKLLEGEGKAAVGSEILDALTFTMPRPKSGTPKVDYAEMASSYSTLRQPNRTHTEAVALLQQTYELLKKGLVRSFTPEDAE